MLQIYLGSAWTLGCCLFGSVVISNSQECRISKQYLCQASLFLTGVTVLGFTAVEGHNGFTMFVWVYGIFCGGYNYTLKMYIYEKVRARNFARAWGFAQFSMALPNLIGVPVAGKQLETHWCLQQYKLVSVFPSFFLRRLHQFWLWGPVWILPKWRVCHSWEPCNESHRCAQE